MKSVLPFALLAAVSLPAQARSQYIADVPNGGTFRCLSCHERSGGGEGWNDFGKALLIEGGANPDANPSDQNQGYDLAFRPADFWLDVCVDDSDGDGATNGEELGDPDCVWASGDANPAADVGNPGDAASTPTDPGSGGAGEGEELGCTAAPLGASVSLLLALAALTRKRKR